jgi:putative hydrolase of the HAD superfamily
MVDRMFGRIRPDHVMVEALRRSRAQGVRTGLVSSSRGAGRYDRAGFPELFDGVVISGDVGMHKPQPEIFLLGARRVGVDRGAESTLPQLEELLGVALRPREAS